MFMWKRLLAARHGASALRRRPGGLLARVGWYGEEPRELSRHDDLEAFPGGIRDDPGAGRRRLEQRSRSSADHEVARSPAVTIERERADVGAAVIVELQLDGHDVRAGFCVCSCAQVGISRRVCYAVGPEAHVLDVSVRSQSHAEFRKATLEFGAVDIVTTGPDAAKEDRLDRSERGEHGMQQTT